MKEKSTQDALIKSKLSATAVPDWKAGWGQLEPLLEKAPDHRPVGIWNWQRLSAVAALVLALVASVWWIGSMRPVSPPAGSVALFPEADHKMSGPKVQQLPEADSIIRHFAPTGRRLVQSIPEEIGSPATPKENITDGAVIPVDDADLRLLPPVAFTGRPAAAAAGVPREVVSRFAPSIPSTTPDLMAAADGAVPSRTDNHFFKGVHVSVGLEANGGSSFGNAASNYNPVLKGSSVDIYPSAFVSKRLGKKLSVGAGIAVASPVNVQPDALNRSVSYPERALFANVSESKDYISISRLYYADVPVVLQYHLGSRFSVGSGVQFSILEKVIGEKQRQDYDNYGALAMALPTKPKPQNLTHANAASGTIRPLDFRWVVGVHYHLGQHWDASVQYQYGLTDISSNKAFLNNNVNRNNVLSAGLNFVIK